MKKDIILLLKNTLITAPGFTAVMGTGSAQRFYALIAPKETTYPFAVYGVGESEPLTKDGGERFPVRLTCCFKQDGYLDGLNFETVLRDIFEDTDFDVQGCDTYADPETPQIVCEMSLTIIND